MFEVIEDSVLLHQAGDEIEISLAVLHAVFAWLKVTGERQFEIGEAAILEHLLNNVGDCHVLKDPTICAAGEEPQPRDNLHLVVGEANLRTGLRKSADEAVDVPLVPTCE